MNEGVGGHVFTGEVRSRIAEAMSTLDIEQISDALVDAVRVLLLPSFAAVFTVESQSAVEPQSEVRLQRYVAEDHWRQKATEPPNFEWMKPLLVPGVANGSSIVGPELAGEKQIAAAVRVGDDRYAYLVIAGPYDDPESVRHRVSTIAVECGASVLTMLRANEKADDLAALRERERLSRDLHDSLSQSLWSLSMLSEMAEAMIEPSDPLHNVMQQIARISLTSQEEMRSLLINLRSAEPSEETVAGSLESLVADFRASHDVEVVASIADADVDAKEAMAFRRIAEEALNNVGRHAEASMVAVLFDAEPVPTLRIGDNGVGFDTKPIEGHLGLRIMAERAAEVGCTLDVVSNSSDGTVVTASADPSAVRPMPWRIEPPAPPSLGQALLFLIVGVILAASAGGVLLISGSSRTEAAEMQVEREVLSVLDERTVLGRAAADEATARLLQGFGVASAADVRTAAADREAAIVEADGVLGAMVNPTSLSGQYAMLVLGEFSESLAAPTGAPLGLLIDEVGSLDSPVGRPTPGQATPTQSVGNLVSLEEVVTFALLETIIARHALDPAAADFTAEEASFLMDNMDIMRDEGGYFGPYVDRPLDGGYYETSTAMVHESVAVSEIDAIIADAGLWDDDQWVRQWTADAGPPPTTIDAYAQRSGAALSEIRSVVDDRLDGRILDVERRLDQRGRSITALTWSAVALGVLSAASLLNALAIVLRRGRTAIRDSTRDHLSGVGNRKCLEEEIVPHLRDPHLNHHVVATLDMDRFKAINDVYGHGFGDRMLEVVGAGLDAMASYSTDIPSVPVRIGGDEFLISFHSANEIPVELVHRAMNRLRSTIVSAPDGTLVRCSFSYGVVDAFGSPDLQSLMAASDLAAYGDKSRTSQARRDNDRLNS